MLLLYIAEGRRFDVDEIRARWSVMAGVRELTEDAFACALECEFHLEDDRVIVRLAQDHETVTLHGTGPAPQEFICRFRAVFGGELHLIDESYSFDSLLPPTVSRQEILDLLIGSSPSDSAS